MDGERFDHLAKSLASGTSRRRVLKGLAGAAAAGLAGVLGRRPAPAEAQTCGAFDDACFATSECCAGLVCNIPAGRSRGKCACPAGTVSCSGQCVPTSCPSGSVFSGCQCVCDGTDPNCDPVVANYEARCAKDPNTGADLYPDACGAYWNGLTSAQQQSIQTFYEVVSITEDEPTVEIAAAGCWRKTQSRSAHNYFGYRLWSYRQTAEWCGNGSSVTSGFRTRQIEVRSFGWSGQHIAGQPNGIVQVAPGDYRYRAFTQGEMKACVGPGGVGCYQYKYPYVEQTGGRNGAYNWRTGG